METRPTLTLPRLAAPIALLALATLATGSPALAQIAKLSGPPPFIPTGITGKTVVSPDSQWVVYEASQDVDERFATGIQDLLNAPVLHRSVWRHQVIKRSTPCALADVKGLGR